MGHAAISPDHPALYRLAVIVSNGYIVPTSGDLNTVKNLRMDNLLIGPEKFKI
jgi:hypothetical protein